MQLTCRGCIKKRSIPIKPHVLQRQELKVNWKLVVMYTMCTRTVSKDPGYQPRPVNQERVMEIIRRNTKETMDSIALSVMSGS